MGLFDKIKNVFTADKDAAPSSEFEAIITRTYSEDASGEVNTTRVWTEEVKN